MKIKLPFNCIIVLPVILLVSCTASQDVKPDIESDILQSQFVSDVFNKFVNDNYSMQNIPSFMETVYGIDFEAEYAKIIPLLSSVHALQVEERGQDLDMRDISTILERNGMGPGTRSYHYLGNVVRLFDNEQSNASMIGEFNRLKDLVISDNELPASEQRKLATALTLIASSYDGIAKGITSNMLEASNERTQGLFNRVWRVIRSIIITSTIGAAIGATGGPVGAIIGAAVTTTAAVSDAQFNHNCHFALQCDGGWRQDCMTGECKPYAQ